MIELASDGQGCILRVRAAPRAKSDAIASERAGALRVRVTAPPEKGKANDAIKALLARELGLRERDVSLVRGATSSDKTFRITGIDRRALEARLAAIVPPVK